MLQNEYEYYVRNQDQLVKKFYNKFIVIMEGEVIGAYKTYSEAYFGALKSGKSGTFLIQYCSPAKETYSGTFPTQIIIKPQTE